MIEVVYNEKKKATSEQGACLKIPKNIRQIGQIDDSKKVYMEDYVITYVHQLGDYCQSMQQAGVFLGHTYEMDGKQYIFINGAVKIDDIETADSCRFDDFTWSNIYENINKYFDSFEIVGWFIVNQELDDIDWKAVTKTHLDHFAGNHKIFVKANSNERDLQIYAYDNNRMQNLNGYYIYYEKNQEMQNYMIDEFKQKEPVKENIIENVEDNATRHFREIIQERKETTEQSKLMVFMYTSSIILIIVVFVIGITLLNNFDKMKSMEQTLANITDSINKEDNDAESEEQMAVSEETQEIPVENAGNGLSLEEAVSQENNAINNAAEGETTDQTQQAATNTDSTETPPAGTEENTAQETGAAENAENTAAAKLHHSKRRHPIIYQQEIL